MTKVFCGIKTRVIGGSYILSKKHIDQLEAALPSAQQCYDWKLIYRMSRDGADVHTMLHMAKMSNSAATILVLLDEFGTTFGAMITERWRDEGQQYFGSPASVAVWSFASGVIQLYPASLKNSCYIMLNSSTLALGGGNAAIYLVSDLSTCGSKSCSTFDSPCLTGRENFKCVSCEVFSLEHVIKARETASLTTSRWVAPSNPLINSPKRNKYQKSNGSK